MTPRIRLPADPDREVVEELGRRLSEGVAPWREPDSIATAVGGWVAEALDGMDAEHSPVFVAELNGEVVGFACARAQRHWSGELDACVGELVVAQGHESERVAQSLMARAENWARQHGFARLTVQTGAGNTRALALYQRLGYRFEDVSLTRQL